MKLDTSHFIDCLTKTIVHMQRERERMTERQTEMAFDLSGQSVQVLSFNGEKHKYTFYLLNLYICYMNM